MNNVDLKAHKNISEIGKVIHKKEKTNLKIQATFAKQNSLGMITVDRKKEDIQSDDVFSNESEYQKY